MAKFNYQKGSKFYRWVISGVIVGLVPISYQIAKALCLVLQTSYTISIIAPWVAVGIVVGSIWFFIKSREAEDNTPWCYRLSAISLYSFFFSVLLGSILLACYVRSWRNKCIVICFGITYMVFLFTIPKILPFRETGPVLYNMAGSLILDLLLRNKYATVNVLYSEKYMLVPILITLIFFIPLVYYLVTANILSV